MAVGVSPDSDGDCDGVPGLVSEGTEMVSVSLGVVETEAVGSAEMECEVDSVSTELGDSDSVGDMIVAV